MQTPALLTRRQIEYVLTWAARPRKQPPVASGGARQYALHYCRVCGERFESSEEQSAHFRLRTHQVVPHVYLQRRLEARCTKDCTGVEQTEEKLAGKQLYGDNVRGYTPKHFASRDERERFMDILFGPDTRLDA